jgi:DNA-binding NarL/FixJ family response regulator
MVRRGILETISDEPDLIACGQAADVREALELLKTQHPDLVIVDISLRGGNGLDLIRQIKVRKPDAAILVLSMHDESLFAERAVAAGASGYLNKAEPSESLLPAIRQVLRGELALSKRVTDRVVKRALDGAGPAAASGNGGLTSLSNREMEVFQHIGQGLPVREIAERLFVSVKTVETHREHVKRKLGLKNSVELVRYATLWAAGRH